MSDNSIQHILKTVEQPSRYIGTEINAIKKDHAECKMKFALAFPDLYDIGTSHFGIQILYSILNSQKDFVAERVFAPAPDMEKALRETETPLFSLESHIPLSSFDIIGFSLLYELNYTNILTILDLAGIPFLSSERNENHPLIIAGGPCTFNPEPVADIFDAMIIGDGETAIIEFAERYTRYKESENQFNKVELLKLLSEIEGVYIPSFFVPEYIENSNGNSLQKLNPVYPSYSTVNRAYINDLEKAPFPVNPVIPFGKPVHDRLRLEISRGCSRGCRFCQAGMIYRPVRERSVSTLIEQTEKSVKSTGYEDISLLSLSTADYGNLNSLMLNLMDNDSRDVHEHLAVSLPSVRAGKLNSELMEIIKKERKTGFTIAPEAGTQKLRDRINKGITEDDIINTVTSACDLGWKTIKLYFMTGLPGETQEDLEGIITLIKTIKHEVKTRLKGKKININVSVSTYIPKAHTPFQWEKQLSEEEAWNTILWLRNNLKIPGVTFKWGKTGISFLEGIMSRGDRRLTPFIINAYEKGCRFDGWNEHFKIDLWKQAAEETGIDPEFYITRKRDIDEPLPWDHINSGIEKEFLNEELRRSEQLILTEDCKSGSCHMCGICDFEKIQPVIDTEIHSKPEKSVYENKNEIIYKPVAVYYSKTGNAKYFGHLELVNIVSKAIKRTGIPVKYTMGNHKKIKLTFNEPLPLGYESLNEFFIIEVKENFDTLLLIDQMNREIPDGLHIIRAISINSKKNLTVNKGSIRYMVRIHDYTFSEDAVNEFHNSDQFFIEKVNKKGVSKSIDLKNIIKNLIIESSDTLLFEMDLSSGITVRPYNAVQAVFSVPESIMKQVDIIKLGK